MRELAVAFAQHTVSGQKRNTFNQYQEHYNSVSGEDDSYEWKVMQGSVSTFHFTFCTVPFSQTSQFYFSFNTYF